MWQLEPQLTPISLLLHEAPRLAERADKSVRAIEEEFELTMSTQSNVTADDDGGVLGESKRHHTPSKSAPVLPARVVALTLRQRENTI